MSSSRAELWIPNPSTKLNPNALRRMHWGQRAKLTKEGRQAGYEAARDWIVDVLGGVMPRWTAPAMRDFWWFTVNRRRDARNLEACTKPHIDGLVDAGLLLDDDRITHLPTSMSISKSRPQGVIIVVWDCLESYMADAQKEGFYPPS